MNETRMEILGVQMFDELQNIKQFLIYPEQMLSNAYDEVRLHSNHTQRKLVPCFKQDNDSGHWICVYRLDWPWFSEFAHSAPNKTYASRMAAIDALAWLKKYEYIDNNGIPIVYEEIFTKGCLNLEDQLVYMLHCVFDKLARTLNRAFPLTSKYVMDKLYQKWVCTYTFNWPDTYGFLEFEGCARRKKDASCIAAEEALGWLIKTGKVSRNGDPVVSENVAFDPLKYIFARPEKVLQNLFHELSYTFKNEFINYHSKLLFDSKSKLWVFTFNFAWPQLHKIKYSADYSEEARRMAALDALSWILNCESVNSVSNLTSLNNNMMLSSDLISTMMYFPQPKMVLHNFFCVLSQLLKEHNLKIIPIYHHDTVMGEWTCSYTLMWPEKKCFTKSSNRKKEACRLAAIEALAWLRHLNQITDRGFPALQKADADNSFKQNESYINLNLNAMKLNRFNKIVQIFEDNMSKIVTTGLTKEFANDNTEGCTIHEPTDVRFSQIRPKLLDKSLYYAIENLILPISKYKQCFFTLLREHQVMIIKGEPGCGKSTKIPQFVLESWAKDNINDNCRIVVTQPRRLAAISLAARVAGERNESVGDIVGYQVRLKTEFRANTGRILYCTTGILLRYLQSDPKLKPFTHIVLDEAHERDVNTDLLMNLLKYNIISNSNIKVIIMSATIDTDMFQNYFDGAPILHIPGFAQPVVQHFIGETLILNELPRTVNMCQTNIPSVIAGDVASVIFKIHQTKPDGAILCFLPGWEDIRKVQKFLENNNIPNLSILCLHSRLQDAEQRKIFLKAPPGIRKVILSTNIAETSVTIDDVVYVVDTGIHKEKRFDCERGVACIDNTWISQASVVQRKGRAGRVRAGESYHLYPQSKFEQFEQYTAPEIMRTSLTKIVLDSKVYSNNMKASDFLARLPCPPEKPAIRLAVHELKHLELLDDNENLTTLGRTLAEFQLEPKLAKTLVNAVIFKCVTPIIDIVTLFSAETELFSSALINKERIKTSKIKYCETSDHLSLMRILEQWLEFHENGDVQNEQKFLHTNSLMSNRLDTIQKLRNIHFKYLYDGLFDTLPISDDFSDCDELVKAVLLSGVGNLLIHKIFQPSQRKKMVSKNLLTIKNEKALLTSDSVNSNRHCYPSKLLMYINETRSNIRRVTTVRECSLISPLAVILFWCKPLILYNQNQSNMAYLELKDTKIKFVCKIEHAQLLCRVKEAIMSCYTYFANEITQGGSADKIIINSWQNILTCLNEILVEDEL